PSPRRDRRRRSSPPTPRPTARRPVPRRTCTRRRCERASHRYQRRCSHSCSLPDGRTPEVEGIAERVGERDAGRPTGLLAKTRGIEGDPRRLAPADPRWVELRVDGDASEREERLEDLRNRDCPAGADVEGPAFVDFESGGVGPRHVADVEEVALGVEATVPYERLREAGFGLGDLLRER